MRRRRFLFQAEAGKRYYDVTGVQTCALPICPVTLGQAPGPAGAGVNRRVRAAKRAAKPKQRQRQFTPMPRCRALPALPGHAIKNLQRLLRRTRLVEGAQREVAARAIVLDAAGKLRLGVGQDRKSTRLNSSHVVISYAVFCLKIKIYPYT